MCNVILRETFPTSLWNLLDPKLYFILVIKKRRKININTMRWSRGGGVMGVQISLKILNFFKLQHKICLAIVLCNSKKYEFWREDLDPLTHKINVIFLYYLTTKINFNFSNPYCTSLRQSISCVFIKVITITKKEMLISIKKFILILSYQ